MNAVLIGSVSVTEKSHGKYYEFLMLLCCLKLPTKNVNAYIHGRYRESNNIYKEKYLKCKIIIETQGTLTRNILFDYINKKPVLLKQGDTAYSI